MNDDDPLWIYVGQISGVLTIFGAIVVIITTIAVALFRPLFHYHLNSTDVSWISFVSGVEAAGALSVAYGFLLAGNKLGAFKDEGKLASIAFFSGAFLMLVAVAGFIVPAVVGTGS
jgi:hypothetical protein